MVYMDEFNNFTTLSLVNMFSELRKFNLGMTIAHQYMNQLDDDITLPNYKIYLKFIIDGKPIRPFSGIQIK